MAPKRKAKSLAEMTADELRALKGEKRAAAQALAEEMREVQGHLTALETVCYNASRF